VPRIGEFVKSQLTNVASVGLMQVPILGMFDQIFNLREKATTLIDKLKEKRATDKIGEGIQKLETTQIKTTSVTVEEIERTRQDITAELKKDDKLQKEDSKVLLEIRNKVSDISEAVLDIRSAIVKASTQRGRDREKEGGKSSIIGRIPEVKKTLVEKVTVIKETAKEKGKSLVDKVKGIGESLTSFLPSGGIMNLLKPLLGFALKRIFLPVSVGLGAYWGTKKILEWTGLDKQLEKLLEKLGAFIYDLVHEPIETIKGLFKSIIESDFVKSITSAVGNVVDKIKGIVSGIYEGIKSAFKSVAEAVGNLIEGVKQTLSDWYEGIKNVFSSVIDTVSGYVDSVKETVSNWYEGFKNVFKSVFSSIGDWLSKVYNMGSGLVSDFLSSPLKTAKELITGTYQWKGKEATTAAAAANVQTPGTPSQPGTIGAPVQQEAGAPSQPSFFSRVKEFESRAAGYVAEKAQTAVSAVTEGAGTVFKGIIAGLGSVKDAVGVAYKWAGPIWRALREFGVTSPNQIVAFLGQVIHETGGFKYLTEVWGPTPVQQRYEGRRDLGNIYPGDGYRFRGRGLIQLTGRRNYEEASKALGIDLVNNPDLVSTDPEIAARVSVWWWKNNKRVMQAAESGDIEAVSRIVNRGSVTKAPALGESERVKKTAAIAAAVGTTAPPPPPPKEQIVEARASLPASGTTVSQAGVLSVTPKEAEVEEPKEEFVPKKKVPPSIEKYKKERAKKLAKVEELQPEVTTTSATSIGVEPEKVTETAAVPTKKGRSRREVAAKPEESLFGGVSLGAFPTVPKGLGIREGATKVPEGTLKIPVTEEILRKGLAVLQFTTEKVKELYSGPKAPTETVKLAEQLPKVETVVPKVEPKVAAKPGTVEVPKQAAPTKGMPEPVVQVPPPPPPPQPSASEEKLPSTPELRAALSEPTETVENKEKQAAPKVVIDDYGLAFANSILFA